MLNTTPPITLRRKRYMNLIVLSVLLFSFCFDGTVFAQSKDSTIRKKVPRTDVGVVKSLTVMPYATISYNFHSGQAFPKGAQGVGYGFGIAFDLTEEKQPLGAYFDFAYQDMRAHATDGACKLLKETDTVTASVPVEHYFSYALFEGFLKLQSLKNNGYFLIGASLGIATTSLTVKKGGLTDEFSDWKGSTFSNSLRLDIRAGLGIKLFQVSGHQVVFEARFGYPITSAITDYHDACNGSDAHGPWRIVTMQGNIGLRL